MIFRLERRRIEIEILKMYALCTSCEYRWSEIRNHLWLAMEIPPDFIEGTFNVNVSRALLELVKEGWLRNSEKGHKNMRYALEPKGLERVIKNFKADPVISFTLVGTYKIGDSYEVFKKKAMKRLEQLFEKDLRQCYEEAKKFDERTKKKKA